MHAAPPNYPIRVINLERDVERLARIIEAYGEQGLQLDRYPGVSGAAIADPLRFLMLGGREGIRTGTLGCALSHVGVWREVAAGERPHVLVIEDDGVPACRLPRAFAKLGIPKDYDLCYVNERMVPLSMRDEGDDRRILPVAEAMLARAPDQRGGGGDGYFVSRRGAKKMLGMFYRDRILAHVDTQLLAYGHTREQLVRLVETNRWYRNMLQLDRHRKGEDVLRSYVMVPPLVRQARGQSTRKAEDGERRDRARGLQAGGSPL